MSLFVSSVTRGIECLQLELQLQSRAQSGPLSVQEMRTCLLTQMSLKAGGQPQLDVSESLCLRL